MTRLTVCTVQPAILWNDPAATFDAIDAQMAAACRAAALDVTVLPEHFNALPAEEGDEQPWIEAQRFAADLAQRYRVHLVAGSVERWNPSLAARVNTCVVYNRDGQEVGRYDKQRLFGFEKRRALRPGAQPLLLTVEGVRLGVLICSDLWHPELARALAPHLDLLCVPAQTTLRPESEPAYARRLWHTLAFTRSQENVIALAASDQSATSVAPFRCGGVSSINDPSAEPDLAAMQRLIDDGGAGFLLAEIDTERLARFRRYRQEAGLLPET